MFTFTLERMYDLNYSCNFQNTSFLCFFFLSSKQLYVCMKDNSNLSELIGLQVLLYTLQATDCWGSWKLSFPYPFVSNLLIVWVEFLQKFEFCRTQNLIFNTSLELTKNTIFLLCCGYFFQWSNTIFYFFPVFGAHHHLLCIRQHNVSGWFWSQEWFIDDVFWPLGNCF